MALPEIEILIVGSGAGGGIAAWVLAEAGYHVTVLEKGPWLSEQSFSNDDVKFGYRDFYTQDALIEPRTFRVDASAVARVNHASPISRCVGGGTLHYGAASPRYLPPTFKAATRFGVPPGSSLADWPISYADLEPHYAAVEQAVGVAGLAPGFGPPTGYRGASEQPPPNALAGKFGQTYSRQYPLPPVNQRYDAIAFREATTSLNYHPYPTPCAINTVEGFQGRHACVNCGFCNGWGCPNGSKSSVLGSVLKRALATGRCQIRPECHALQVVLDSRGRARSVLYIDPNFNVQEQPARLVILACSTVDTPRLALLSGLDKHDQSGMIGHNLTVHHAPSAVVEITDGVHSWDTYRGAWNTISVDDFQDLSQANVPGNPLFPWGGLVSCVGNSPGYPVGTGGPVSLAESLVKPPGFYQGGGNAFAPTGAWGAGFFQTVTQSWGTEAFLLGVAEDLPVHGNAVDLDPQVKDVYGLPVARITYLNHPNDTLVGQYMSSQLVDIGSAMLNAIGAGGRVVPIANGLVLPGFGGGTIPAPTPITSYAVGPRYNPHQHGTMRMGNDPGSSVTNRYGQFWAIPNLFIADGSLFTTAGSANPTHTIEALAHWVATHIAQNGASLLSRPS
jgi:choline dehydrogenase-like flavoprotein